MKSLFLFFQIFCLLTFSYAQRPQLTLEYNTLDRGEILHKGNGVFKFPFTNTGVDTLIISSVKSSCGCLVPYYNNKPIPPGESDTIYGKYDTKRLGIIHKTMTIQSNDPDNPRQIIRIRGVVYEKIPPIRIYSTDSLPKKYHRTFHTKHIGKQINLHRSDSSYNVNYTIKESDSIELYLENSSTDTLAVNLENLTSLEIVKWSPAASQVMLLPNESVKLQFSVVDCSDAPLERRREFATISINDNRLTLQFSYPYQYR